MPDPLSAHIVWGRPTKKDPCNKAQKSSGSQAGDIDEE